MITEEESVSIIGPGALGKVLSDFFIQQKYPVQSIWDRSTIYFYQNGKKVYEKPRNDSEFTESDLGSFVFITVPDDQIASISELLANSGLEWGERKVVHCSGSLMSDECSALKRKGAKIASMHPIQTFTAGDGIDKLQNIYVSLEGDTILTNELSILVKHMGSTPLILKPDQKRGLHLAAVIACNYLVALLHQSEKVLKNSDQDSHLEILEPLISQTIRNIYEKGIMESLSGPVVRGDIDTVNKHLEMLKDQKALQHFYKVMGSIALSISNDRGSLQESQKIELERLFQMGS